MNKEQHRVVAYLGSHSRLEGYTIEEFDDAGTLSHLLMLLLAQWERELKADKKQLPPEEIPEQIELEEDDAERQTAFSYLQKRAKAKERREKESRKRKKDDYIPKEKRFECKDSRRGDCQPVTPHPLGYSGARSSRRSYAQSSLRR